MEKDAKMVTISIYDFEDKNVAHDTYQKYVLNLIEKEYKSGPLSEGLQNDCFSATINQSLQNEKTSIVCVNSNYIIISTSEQSDYVYHNEQQFTTTIAANGFSYTIFQNIENFKSNIPEWVKNNAMVGRGQY